MLHVKTCLVKSDDSTAKLKSSIKTEQRLLVTVVATSVVTALQAAPTLVLALLCPAITVAGPAVGEVPVASLAVVALTTIHSRQTQTLAIGGVTEVVPGSYSTALTGCNQACYSVKHFTIYQKIYGVGDNDCASKFIVNYCHTLVMRIIIRLYIKTAIKIVLSYIIGK